MKTALPVLSLVLTVCCWNLTAVAQCRVEVVNYRGWNVLKMSNELLELSIVPEIGGRIIQFVFDGHGYLFVNDSLAGKVLPYQEGEWNNYGGDKLWPAPQGWDGPHQWPGPGDPILDGGRFIYEILQAQGKRASVHLASPPDKERTQPSENAVLSRDGDFKSSRHSPPPSVLHVSDGMEGDERRFTGVDERGRPEGQSSLIFHGA
jgi:hypothetical protein